MRNAQQVLTYPQPKPWWRSARNFYAPGPGQRALLWTRELTIASVHADAPLIDHLNLSIRGGCLTALVDRNSSRSRALFMALAGLSDIDDRAVRYSRRSRALYGGSAGVALITGHVSYDSTLTVRENVMFPLAQCGISIDRAELDRIMSLCQLAGHELAMPTQLGPDGSLRIAVAQALLCGAQILLLEDPTRGLVHGISEAIYDFLRKVAHSGCALVFSTADLRWAALADRAVLIANGSVACDMAYPDMGALSQAYAADTDTAGLLGPVPQASYDSEHESVKEASPSWFPVSSVAQADSLLAPADMAYDVTVPQEEDADSSVGVLGSELPEFDFREAEPSFLQPSQSQNISEVDNQSSSEVAVLPLVEPKSEVPAPQKKRADHHVLHVASSDSAISSASSQDVVERAQKILQELPGPIFHDEALEP
ncbi:hypothetical protein [Schaalia sp. lx-100]|uniref:hypothetical protein n=1 Tax=Schaalia sp. lx-100 TaxID=2899081 RepID=UPI001E53585F|nr:hypothetical protein [Schaalia sp. lx-100]MCD4557506.1 hypothetical protein [Schaalia sp. lx-100]